MQLASGDIRRIAIVVVLAIAVLAAWTAPLDQQARDHVDESLERALITFGAARALNAVISAVQGTELTFGFGAQATLSVGEVLDPINDLVEQFSNLMLLASVSLGIQNILLAIGAHAAISGALTVIAVVWAAFYLRQTKAPRLLTGFLILALMARFAIPMAVVGTNAIFEQFLQDQYQEGTTQVEAAAADIREALPATGLEVTPDGPTSSPQPSPAPTPPPSGPAQPQVDGGLIDKVKDLIGFGAGKQPPQAVAPAGPTVAPSTHGGWLDSAWDRVGDLVSPPKVLAALRQKIEALKEIAELTTDHVIDLMVVFVLETLIVPLAILWGLYLAVRALLTPSATASLERLLDSRLPRQRETLPVEPAT